MAVNIGNLYYIIHDHGDRKIADVTYPNINENYISGSIKIPEKIIVNGDEYEVVTIGRSAFKNCTELENVILPKTVTKILNDAFSGCTSLRNLISRTTNLIGIGNNIVYGCTALDTINFSFNVDSVPEIRGNSFDHSHNCPIYIPYSGDVYLHHTNWQYTENIKNRLIPYKNLDDTNDFGTAIFYGYSPVLFTEPFEKSQINLMRSDNGDTFLQQYSFPQTDYNKYIYFLVPIELVDGINPFVSVKSYDDVDDGGIPYNILFKEELDIIGDYFMDNNIYRFFKMHSKQNKDANTYIIS